MPQLQPSWQLSALTAAVLLVVVLACRTVLRGRRGAATAGSFAREFSVVMALLGLWQYVGALVHTRVAGAMDRAREIAALEAWLRWPRELAVQRAVLPHPWLVTFSNTYYAYAHLNGMALFVLWLWWRHRDVYPRMRTVMIVSTLACFLVQVVPVAPPRLLPELGFTDTAMAYGQSVYGDFGSGVANQLAAMPSVHVGWALIVGWFVWRCAPRPWRWAGPLHAALTLFVVVATANHWWLDGVVAGLLVLAAAGVAPAWAWARRTVRRVAVEPSLQPSLQLSPEPAAEPRAQPVRDSPDGLAVDPSG